MTGETKGALLGYLVIILGNSIPMICLTILAIVFNHWWLVLFSFLFWSKPNLSISSNNKVGEINDRS